jgi:muramoyltetrapeptide carboxypeptidase LdcA involved in peptidoglycan recycling
MVDIEDEKPDPACPEEWYGKAIEEIVLDHVPQNIPIVFNVPCGHGKYISTFPVGGYVKIMLEKNCLSMSFAP